jgi:hypothetical protein
MFKALHKDDQSRKSTVIIIIEGSYREIFSRFVTIALEIGG